VREFDQFEPNIPLSKLLLVLPRRLEPGERRGRKRRATPLVRFIVVVLVVAPGPVIRLLPEDVAIGGGGAR
jgi:hypothetical protein